MCHASGSHVNVCLCVCVCVCLCVSVGMPLRVYVCNVFILACVLSVHEFPPELEGPKLNILLSPTRLNVIIFLSPCARECLSVC